MELLLSFSYGHLSKYLQGTRAKPWDDRELDLSDGIKFMSFVMYTSCMTAFMMFYSWITDLIAVMDIVKNFLCTAAISFNIGLETFFFLSTF